MPFWSAAEPLDGQTGSLTSTGFGLYSGMAGIGVFAAELARQSDDKEFVGLAQACRKGVRLGLDSGAYGLGAFNGASGLLYAEICMALSLGERPGRELLPYFAALERFVDHDTVFDIIGGVAGTGILALRASRIEGLEPLSSLAVRCGTRLMQGAVADENSGGVRWPSPQGGSALAGFAHGAAGNAAALALIGAATDDQAMRALAWSGLRFARQGYDGSRDVWVEEQAPDAKSDVAGSMAWCHGTPGKVIAGQIVRSALASADPVCPTDHERRGLRACADRLSEGNDSLCHGILGNLEPLLGAETADRRLATDVAHAVAERGHAGEYRCSIGGGRNPGLMLGLAGMGHQLLRISGARAANVLRLELPDHD